MVPSTPPEDRLAQTLQREVVRRKRLTAALVLASCAVTVVSAVTFRERRELQRATAELAACERACRGPAPERSGAGFHVPARTLPAPQAIPDILAVPLEVACEGGDVRDATLDLAAATGVVHLVNLWQLSCPGCIREFPLLARALDRAGRGVRFLPVDDPGIRPPASDYAVARARHRMPTPSLALIDRGLDGARLLPALGPLLAAPVYPLSFVLDCDKQLRWWKVGALDETEADALAELLVRLRDEPSCRPDVPPPDVCRDPARARVVHRERVRRERLIEVPLDVPVPAAPDPVPVESVPVEPVPSVPPAEPAPPVGPTPSPVRPPRRFPSREACQAECHAERHTCQIAPRGAYQCAPPPDTE